MGIVTLQMKHNASSIYLQNDGFWHQFNPLFHGSPLLTNSSLMKVSYHVWMMSKSQKSRKSFIHGSHGEHGFFNVAQKSRKFYIRGSFLDNANLHQALQITDNSFHKPFFCVTSVTVDSFPKWFFVLQTLQLTVSQNDFFVLQTLQLTVWQFLNSKIAHTQQWLLRI